MWKLLAWAYKPHNYQLFGAQAIIGMAFGANQKGSAENPGGSNEAIACIIARLWNEKNLPVIAQREVAEAMGNLNPSVNPVLVISEMDGQSHINSRDVLLQAWKYCEPLNKKKVIIVAHSAHILRCAWVAEKIGFSVRLADVSSVPYEPGSRQWWTRHRFLYAVWEACARIGWMIRGYL